MTVEKFVYDNPEEQNAFIQDLLFDSPDVLPINELNEEYGPLIPLGKNIETDTGIIDNLFISPNGNITIVETKVRKKTAPQIFDFRYELQDWKIDKLNQISETFQNKNIFNLLNISDKEQIKDISIKISENLLNRRFLLLIVSEKMNPLVERIFDKFPSIKNPSHLGLVRLNIFKNSESGKFIIIPSTAYHPATVESNEKVTYKEAVVEIKADLDNAVRNFNTDEEKFFEKLKKRVDISIANFCKLIATDAEKIGCIIEWKETSLILKLAVPKKKNKTITLFMIQIYGECVQGNYEEQFAKYKLPEDMHKKISNDLIFNMGFKKGKLPLEHLKPNYDKFLSEIEKIKEGVNNA
ncbi:MAG: hypothetical protein ACEPO8_09915 [Rhodothermaceae bacterium]